MKLCVDLYSGMGGFSQAFIDTPGWDVIRIDNDPRFESMPHTKIMDVEDATDYIISLGRADIILASYPCDCFSVASIGAHWTGGKEAYEPKDEATFQAIQSVKRLDNRIRYRFATDWGIIENPRGVLRKVFREPDYTVCLCQYGDDRMKPTDLWGRLPPSFVPKMCRNGNTDHAEARRGAKTGTQGRKGSAERSKMPIGLSRAILEAIEST